MQNKIFETATRSSISTADCNLMQISLSFSSLGNSNICIYRPTVSPLIPLSCLFYRDPSPRCFHFHTISSRSSTSHHHATPIVSALLSRCICRTMNARNVDAIDEITCFPVAHYYGLQIMCILRSPSLTARGGRIGSAPIFCIHPALLCLQYQLKTKVARESATNLSGGRTATKIYAEASTCTAAIRRLIFISTFDRT